MDTIDTTRVRQEWIDSQLDELGTLTRFAEKLGVAPSTASRWIDPAKEATPRFIGSVLNNFPVTFDEAFMTTREAAIRQRIQIRKKPSGQASQKRKEAPDAARSQHQP